MSKTTLKPTGIRYTSSFKQSNLKLYST